MRRVLMTISLFIATPAWATTKKLDMQLIPQQTNEWCWAASAQMAMSYLGATEISQCEEVNYRCDNPYDDDWDSYNCGNVDCCKSPTPDKCINGGSVSADLNHWYFTYDVGDGALTWDHLKGEIDAGRPVIWAESFIPDGGHVLIASGYQEKADGTRKVWVLDPWEPNEGDTYWLSYADYDHIKGYYTHQDDLWHIKDNPQCHSTFHGVASADMQDCFDYQVERGRYLETLSANRASSDSITMQGAWRTGSTPFRARFNLSSSEYQDAFDKYYDAGYRPKQVTVTPSASGDPLFTAVFVKFDSAFTSKANETLSDFDNDVAHPQAGYSLADFSVYDVGGTALVAATWVKESVSWRARYGMTKESFDSYFDQYKKDGFRVERFNAYNTSNGVRYAALWRPSDGTWAMYYDMSYSDYQTRTTQLLDDGYRVYSITALDNVYAAIWVK